MKTYKEVMNDDFANKVYNFGVNLSEHQKEAFYKLIAKSTTIKAKSNNYALTEIDLNSISKGQQKKLWKALQKI